MCLHVSVAHRERERERIKMKEEILGAVDVQCPMTCRLLSISTNPTVLFLIIFLCPSLSLSISHSVYFALSLTLNLSLPFSIYLSLSLTLFPPYPCSCDDSFLSPGHSLYYHMIG